MTRNTTPNRFLPFILLALLLPAAAAIGAAPERIVVFGDSLSDPGNAFALTGAVSHKPYAPIPSAPYPGQHFSDGETWVEQLARDLGALPSAGPAFRRPPVFSNYAVGGARARAAGTAPTLTNQVTMFLDDHGGQAPADYLYVVAIGGNDLRDLFDPAVNAPNAADLALQSIGANLSALVASGARRFLVVNQPDFGQVPAILFDPGLTPAQRAAISDASQAFNAALETLVLGPIEALPAVQITRVDAFGLSQDVAANQVGLDAGPVPCLSFGTQRNAVCRERDEHFYWDAIHPTRAGHAVIAERARAALGE